jgi:predicted PurR-regulated permease PerM
MKKRQHARALGVIITFSLIILLIVPFFVALIPQLISSIRLLIDNMSGYGAQLNEMLGSLQEYAEKYNIDISNYTTAGSDLVQIITNRLPQSLNALLNTTISYGVEVFNIVISSIIAVYMLLDKQRLMNGLNRLWRVIVASEGSYQRSTDFLGRCNHIMLQFILSDLLDGFIVGIANAIFMLIIGYPYVPLISVVVGVTNLAPTFGPIVGGAVGAFILFLSNPWYALGFLIFTFILQTIDGYIIKPKLFGGQLGVPSIWILIALIVFGRMWGVVGILLAIPFAAILDFIYQDVILFRLEQRKKKAAAAEAAAKGSSEVSPGHSQQPESGDPD